MLITIDMLIDMSSFSGIKSLPSPSLSSKFKKLTAKECSLESVALDLFHFQLEEADLSGNKGEE